MRLRYRLLVLDIDGTLVTSSDEIAETTRVALTRALESGLLIILATGRRYSRVLPILRDLGLTTPVVTSSGALIKDPRTHRTLYRSDFEKGLLHKVVGAVQNRGFPIALLGDTWHAGFDYFVQPDGPSNRFMEEYLALNPGSDRPWGDFQRELPPDIFAAFSLGSAEEMAFLAEQLQKIFPGQLTTNVLRSPRYAGFFCEIMPAGTTKWSAVSWLAEQLGVSAGEICAVGDDINDLCMVSQAGLGVAMGNAIPEVKAVARWVAPTHDEDGLAYVIRRLLLENPYRLRPMPEAADGPNSSG